jgi:hypothetical protein
MMQDSVFRAQLKSAKLTAKTVDEKTIRRVQFALSRNFGPEDAEWMGEQAIRCRELLLRRDLSKFDFPIDAYHAKACFAGVGGNAEVDVDGILASATVVGKDESEHEEITYTFEAFPDGKLLTFLASALKEWIDCDLKCSQLTIEQAAPEGSDF